MSIHIPEDPKPPSMRNRERERMCRSLFLDLHRASISLWFFSAATFVIFYPNLRHLALLDQPIPQAAYQLSSTNDMALPYKHAKVTENHDKPTSSGSRIPSRRLRKIFRRVQGKLPGGETTAYNDFGALTDAFFTTHITLELDCGVECGDLLRYQTLRGFAMIDNDTEHSVISRSFADRLFQLAGSRKLELSKPFSLIDTLAGPANALIETTGRWHFETNPNIRDPWRNMPPKMVQSSFYIMEEECVHDVIIGRRDIVEFGLRIPARSNLDPFLALPDGTPSNIEHGIESQPASFETGRDAAQQESPRSHHTEIGLTVDRTAQQDASGLTRSEANQDADPEDDPETDPEDDQETDREEDQEADQEADREADQNAAPQRSLRSNRTAIESTQKHNIDTPRNNASGDMRLSIRGDDVQQESHLNMSDGNNGEFSRTSDDTHSRIGRHHMATLPFTAFEPPRETRIFNDTAPKPVQLETTLAEVEKITRHVPSASSKAFVASKRPSKEQEFAAIQFLGTFLAAQDELRALQSNLLTTLGISQFVENYERVLVVYVEQLDLKAQTTLEKAAVRILGNRTNRRDLALEVIRKLRLSRNRTGLIEPSNGTFRLPQSNEQSPTQWAQDVGQAFAILQYGAPLQALELELGYLALPTYLRKIIETTPKRKILFADQSDVSFSNRFKLFLERSTMRQWDWWPLRPPVPVLEQGNSQLEWTVSRPLCLCS
jgi:hypothetical protein